MIRWSVVPAACLAAAAAIVLTSAPMQPIAHTAAVSTCVVAR